ncbi:MAG: hypothetical protein ABI333_12965 [bacterium]
MPLTEEEKNYIVDTVAEILKAPDKKERIAALRERVLAAQEGTNTLDDAVYSVLQAIDELYG